MCNVLILQATAPARRARLEIHERGVKAKDEAKIP
ncbi:MAG: hypothetical protein UX37_C0006G0024 [Microgenomates group bacterium GW2011_GWA2_46_16]|nr:MAG: hypothetical protein UX37_C0006G0024 [Microgenomates group bacterium GW2011_GWA2_46_16]